MAVGGLQRGDDKGWAHRLGPCVAVYAAATIACLLLLTLPFSRDYVGLDSDDTMRLVEVRNFLNGQGWFDMTEPRLGLAGGTLMHWSRLVDLPIAALILLFGLFLAPTSAEAVALAVWPLCLTVPTLAAMGLAGRRLGGTATMHAALALTAAFLASGNRFLPGAIDHHNVQLLLMAVLAAGLTDPKHGPLAFALAGLAGAVALAVGAETTPVVAVAAMVVAVLWAWHGRSFARAAAAFALTITCFVTLSFFATVPSERYAQVVCDSLSLGYYGITAVGGALLFLAALFASGQSRAVRLALLFPIAGVVLGTAAVLAPQCLGDPLGNLDPLIRTIWLDHVFEARSFVSVARNETSLFGGYYAPGFLATIVCLFRILRRDRPAPHAVMLPLLVVSLVIALIQVRGAIFLNLFSILPLALLITELRAESVREKENVGAAFFYLMTVLLSLPVAWALIGVFALEGTAGIGRRLHPNLERPQAGNTDCRSGEALAQLGKGEPGTVAAPTDLGPPILRFTPHRVLAGPYHRNQGGMLTEMHIGLAVPEEAIAFLRGGDVKWIAFCPTDGETRQIAAMKPDGLYAKLARGEVPPYLIAIPTPPGQPIRLYRFLP